MPVDVARSLQVVSKSQELDNPGHTINGTMVYFAKLIVSICSYKFAHSAHHPSYMIGLLAQTAEPSSFGS